MRIRIDLELDVDLEAWEKTYGLALASNPSQDARDHLGELVLDAVENLPHLTQEHLAQVTKATVTAGRTSTILREA